MRTKYEPVLTFRLPPSPPAKVAAVQEAFDDVANRYAALAGELEDALAAVEAAKEKDAERNAEAFMAGKPTPKVLDANEREALAKAAGLRAALNAAAKAVDGAGNALVRSVPAAQEEWLASLQEREAEAVARYEKAMAEAQAALTEIAPLRGGIDYLEQFNVGEVLTGRGREWHGKGRLRVEGDGFGPLRGEHDPADLLRIAARAVKPIPKPEPRTHGPANVVRPS